MNNTARLASIETILGHLPPFKCVEGCHDCCGPVAMSRLERKRIEQRIGGKIPEPDADMSCGLLKDGRCSVYDIRPAICRVFGISDHTHLTCPHVNPEHKLTVEQTNSLVDSVVTMGHGLILP